MNSRTSISGPRRAARNSAYDVTVDDVEVTDGKLTITFTANVQSPAIDGIEIIPAQ